MTIIRRKRDLRAAQAALTVLASYCSIEQMQAATMCLQLAVDTRVLPSYVCECALDELMVAAATVSTLGLREIGVNNG